MFRNKHRKKLTSRLGIALVVNTLDSNNDVTIYWVSGHVGVNGNKEVDKLVKIDAETLFCGPDSFCSIGSKFIRHELTAEEYELRN